MKFAVAIENFNKNKRAYAMQLTHSDNYRIGVNWYSVKDKVRWNHGDLVEEVSQIGGRHVWTAGKMIEAYDLTNNLLMTYRIDHIQMTNLDELTPTDFEALCYKDLADMREADLLFNIERCWLVRVTPIEQE